MAAAEPHSNEHHDDHGDHHDHGEFIAHHFDSPRQQFDSGKLGIWLFLVTEILFFGGLFVAYTLYRSLNPEIFEQAHVFLDKWLGGVNTVVLLFSSLTMAWAVRCAQLGKNKGAAFFILITMICAAVFLGVKAVEYSHKWDQGILVRSAFDYQESHPDPKTAIGQALHISDYLVYMSVIPAMLLIGFGAVSAIFKTKNNKHQFQFWAAMALTAGGYFLGAIGADVYMKVKASGGHVNAPPIVLMAQETADAEQEEPATAPDGTLPHESSIVPDTDEDDHDESSHEETETGHDESDGHSHSDGAGHTDDGHASDGHSDEDHDDHASNHHGPDPSKFSRDIGFFFSIYYCMTGLHAIHIVFGIIFLAWLLWRSLAGHWRSDYFGPVDYVGLYWHLVDLIWIFLFPMLYLID